MAFISTCADATNVSSWCAKEEEWRKGKNVVLGLIRPRLWSFIRTRTLIKYHESEYAYTVGGRVGATKQVTIVRVGLVKDGSMCNDYNFHKLSKDMG